MMESGRRRVRWQRLDRPGAERSTLYHSRRFWFLVGKIDTEFAGVPSKIAYQIVCDESWSTRIVIVKIRSGRTRARQSLWAHEDGRWFSHGGVERPDLAGCTDVDLEASPSTNTLPIRRLRLDVDEAREVRAAWVRFPGLTVEPLRQRYTRIGEDRYRYESLDSGFSADIDVDDAGLVVHYPGGWTRMPSARGRGVRRKL